MKIKNILPAISYNNDRNLPELINKGTEKIKGASKQVNEFFSKETATALRSVFHSSKIVRKTVLRSASSGEAVAAYITKTGNNMISSFVLRNAADEKKLGTAMLMRADEPSFANEKIKDYMLNSLELVSLTSINSGSKTGFYKGIGTELIKECVRESINKGFRGRIHLDALDRRPPTPFYFKCGFRFPDEEKNILMKEYLEGKIKNNFLPDSIKQGLMYLPDENISKVLEL